MKRKFNTEETSHIMQEHKEEGILCKNTNLCCIAGCHRYSLYNFPGMPKSFCRLKDDMMNIYEYEYAQIHKIQCIECCDTARWGIIGNPYEYCNYHRNNNMIKIPNDKHCIIAGCFSFKNYNFPGLPKKYCEIHKADGMIKIIRNRKIIF